MATYGLTESGFILPSYDDIFNQYESRTKLSFGTDVATSTNSVIGQLLGIISYQDMTIWEGLQAVYNSQTLNGAEGIYLDDILSKRGIVRKGATAGYGMAFLKTNKNALWSTTITPDYYFTGTNSLVYVVTADTKLSDRVAAYQISKTEASPNASITYTIRSAVTGGISTQVFNPSLSTFLTTLMAFIQPNLEETDRDKVFIANNVLYFGFNSTDTNNPVGLDTSISFFSDISVGTKWSLIPAQSQDTGYNPLGQGQIQSISSVPNGYLGVGNFTAFSSGTNVETDAEYRARFNDNLDEANASTAPAIYKAISDLDGVTKVKIYDNPTSTPTPQAAPFSFNTVVFGGNGEEIAQTLYDKKPINTKTDGTVTYNITTADGAIEIIRFTFAEQSSYSIKISYSTIDGKELSTSEKTAIQNALTTLQTQFEIGTTVFNAQIKGAVFSALTYGRLRSLSVLTKETSAPDTAFTEADIVPNYYSQVVMDLSNISYDLIL